MKAPKYLKVSGPRLTPEGQMVMDIKVAWWGWPIMWFEIIKRDYDIKWYGWPLAMVVLVKVWIKTVFSVKRGEGIDCITSDSN